MESYQKSEEGLRQKIEDCEQAELRHEEAKTQLLGKMKEQTTMLEEVENLKMQADEENVKLQELLAEADNQLRQVE